MFDFSFVFDNTKIKGKSLHLPSGGGFFFVLSEFAFEAYEYFHRGGKII